MDGDAVADTALLDLPLNWILKLSLIVGVAAVAEMMLIKTETLLLLSRCCC